MNNKTYILLKDLPDAKSGSEYIFNETNQRYYLGGNILGSYWDKEYVENNPEWFKIKENVEEKINIKLNYFRENGIGGYEYILEVSNIMHVSKMNKIKQAIKEVLNGEDTCPIAQEESTEDNFPMAMNDQTSRNSPTPATDTAPQKDYEILSFIDSHGNIYTQEKPLSTIYESYHNWVNAYFDIRNTSLKFNYHSVKRLSDGKVFSLGFFYKGKYITGFREAESCIIVSFDGFDAMDLNSIK